MTKKTLIELMLENNVQWPEGAGFAVQDKASNFVYFYCDKPSASSGTERWKSEIGFISGIKLPKLCHNWHCTIVTREQYEAAQVKKNASERIMGDVKTNKCIGKLHVDVHVSDIINQIAHHQAESQRHEEAMLDHNEKELALRDQLNEMLAKVGMKVVDNTMSAGTIIKTTGEELHTKHHEYEVVKPNKWPDYCDENGIVVDWDKVPEGSQVECVQSKGSWFAAGDVVDVIVDSCGDKGPYSIGRSSSSYTGIINGTYKFRLIK